LLITGEDRLFNVQYNQFSTDEGRNWFTDTTGIEGNDWSELVKNGYSRYSTSEGFVLASKNFWYLYSKGRWMKLRDGTGTPISRTHPAAMDFAGNYLYYGREYVGLYRIPVSGLTSIQIPVKEMALDEVIAYPNPFTGQTTISYKLRDAKDVMLRLCNSLGETILICTIADRTGEFIWDGKNSAGKMLSSGIYYLTVHRNGVPIRSIPLILLR